MPRQTRRRALPLAIVLAAGMLGGCTTMDSYMDPSVLGRWEYTPTTVPVLTYISSIEDRPQEILEYSAVTAEDLLPNPADYRLGPGDRIEVKLHDLIAQGQVDTYQRTVDIRGLADIPQLGRFYLNGRNIPQAKAMIAERMKSLVADPLVELDILEARQQTFSIVGGVERPGTYIVPRPDYRLLEGLTSGGRLEPSAKWIYVVRLVPLDAALDVPTGKPPVDVDATTPAGPNGEAPKTGEGVLDVINSIGGEKPADKSPSPGAIRGHGARDLAMAQPGKPREPAIDLTDPATNPAATPAPAKGAPAPAKPVEPAVTPGPQADPAPWVFMNGKWTQVRGARPGKPGQPAVGLAGEDRRPAEIVTQRVIRVPRDRLEAGDGTSNVILRPGDVVRVPEPIQGVFYVGGQVRRPGSFILPQEGRMTMLRALQTAGGLDSLAWPERAELIRALGEGRQAIVSVNMRAIAEGTQPDVYIKPDDQINVGTSFWATPLAVLRNGLRTSYGFGFLLDRNFGNEVFGVPPEYKSRARSPFLF